MRQLLLRRKNTFDTTAQGPRRRVWWAPTTDKERSDFGGMFWTATVVKKTKSSYKVVYDNGLCAFLFTCSCSV